MKTFGKIVATVGALVIVGTLTLGAVSYAWAQDTQASDETPTAQRQQRWGNGSHFGDGAMGWFVERFGDRIHDWMGQHMDGPMGRMGMMGGRMGGMGAMGDMGMMGGNLLPIVAQTLDMSEADVRIALVDGKSVADLATEKSVDLQTVIEAIMVERKANLDQAVAAGKITQERADQMLANMAQMLPEHLNQPFAPGNGMLGSGLRWGTGFERGFNMLATVATTLNMPEADLLAAVQDGKTIAAIAAEQGVDLQKVSDAILAERKTQLDDAVAAGTITQARADLILQNMTENLPTHLSQPLAASMGMGFSQRGQRGGMHHGQGNGPMGNQDDENQ